MVQEALCASKRISVIINNILTNQWIDHRSAAYTKVRVEVVKMSPFISRVLKRV